MTDAPTPAPANAAARWQIPWGPRRVALGVVVVAAVTLLGFVVGLLVFPDDERTAVWVGLGATAILELTLVAAAYWWGPRAVGRARSLLGPARLAARATVGWAALAFFASIVVTLAYVVALASFTGDVAVPPPIPASFLERLPLLTVALVVLVGPAAEELFFRGFCFAGLLSRWGLWPAALVSSAVFGVAHVDPALMGPAAVSGFVFAWVYWRTGSLWPVVLAHMARNALALAAAGSL